MQLYRSNMTLSCINIHIAINRDFLALIVENLQLKNFNRFNIFSFKTYIVGTD